MAWLENSLLRVGINLSYVSIGWKIKLGGDYEEISNSNEQLEFHFHGLNIII